MRKAIKPSGLALLAALVAVDAASAQTVIQPQYQPGTGSSQPSRPQPGPTPGANQAPRPFASPPQGSTQGPVTGYGAGGMVRAPGMAPNPPYSRSGR